MKRRWAPLRGCKKSAFTTSTAVRAGIFPSYSNFRADAWQALIAGTPLRLLVQASAGTGKSFLLTTLYLWCLVHNKHAKACAPTGIAAANVEINGTDVSASTIHAMLDLDIDLKSKLDFAKQSNDKVAALMALEVLFVDEVSQALRSTLSSLRLP